MAEDKKWIQGAVKHPGAFTKKAEERGMSVSEFAATVTANPEKYDKTTVRQANLAKTLKKLRKKKGK
jgi:cytidylate kinase